MSIFQGYRADGTELHRPVAVKVLPQAVLVASLLERAVPSPDGRFLAGVHRTGMEAPFTISVLDLSGGRIVHSIPDVSISTGTTSLAWMADSRTLLFVTAERMNIWKQPAMGGPREKLTNF